MDREQLDSRCEKGILWLILAVLLFAPLSAGGVLPYEFLVLQALTIGVLVLWAVRIWVRPGYRLLWPPICWAVLAFTTYAILRYHTSDLEYVARTELIRVVMYAALFLAIVDNLHRQDNAQTITFALIFLGMAISMYAVYQFVTNSPYVWHLLRPEIKPDIYMKRASGTYICPNHLAGFLEMVLPIALAYTLTGRFKHTTKVFLGYAGLMMMAGIGVTLSRGGWLAAGLALAVFFALLLSKQSSRRQAIVFLALLAIAGYFAFQQANHAQRRWQDIFRENGVVYDIRFYLWKPAVRIWREHFWWGAGPGHFDYRFPAHRPELVQQRPGRVHNDYLNTLTDWGTTGGILVAGALVCLIWGTFKTWRFVRRSGDFVSKPSSRASFVLGAGIGIFALLLHSVVDFNMQIPGNAIVAVGLMALLTGYIRFATERFWISPNWLIRSLLTIALLAGVIYLSQQGARRFREARLLTRADSLDYKIQQQTRDWSSRWEGMQAGTEVDISAIFALGKSIQDARNERLELLKLAYQIEPTNFETTYKIGTTLQDLSEQGSDRKLANEAIEWYERGMKLNPFDGYNYLRAGTCLHWIGKHAEAAPYFERSLALDPNSFYTVAFYGVHLFYSGKYDEAKPFLERSLQLADWRGNVKTIGALFLALIENRTLRGVPVPPSSQ